MAESVVTTMWLVYERRRPPIRQGAVGAGRPALVPRGTVDAVGRSAHAGSGRRRGTAAALGADELGASLWRHARGGHGRELRGGHEGVAVRGGRVVGREVGRRLRQGGREVLVGRHFGQRAARRHGEGRAAHAPRVLRHGLEVQRAVVLHGGRRVPQVEDGNGLVCRVRLADLHLRIQVLEVEVILAGLLRPLVWRRAVSMATLALDHEGTGLLTVLHWRRSVELLVDRHGSRHGVARRLLHGHA